MQLPQSLTTVTPLSKALAMVLFVILPFGGVYIGFKYSQSLDKDRVITRNVEINKCEPTKTPTVTQTLTTPTPMTSKKHKNRVFIYANVIKSENADGAVWPTYKVTKLDEQGKTEILIPSIGGVKQHVSFFNVTPDKKSLLVGINNRLMAIDLTTKAQIEVMRFESENGAGRLTYSADKKKLLVWDQAPGMKNSSYSFYEYNLEKKEKKILKSGLRDDLPLEPVTERDDNKILLADPRGEFLELWEYDLNTNELTDKKMAYGHTSGDGKIMAVVNPNDNFKDACNDFSGVDFGSYKFIDPVSENLIDTLKVNGKTVNIEAISKNGDKVLFYTRDPIDQNLSVSDYRECKSIIEEQKKSTKYMIKTIGKGVEEVNDFEEVLADWEIDNIGRMVRYNEKSGTTKLYFGGKEYAIGNGGSVETITMYYE
jgi:hypothetical protein